MTEVEKKDRLFLFIDEGGDPGDPGDDSSSDFYLLNLLLASRSNLRSILKHFARFRYFRDFGAELKRMQKGGKCMLSDLLSILSDYDETELYSFYVKKKGYLGPYLGRKGSIPDPKKFRNFILRKSLEYFFLEVDLDNIEKREVEIVIDRFLSSEEDELNLKKYISRNYRLPSFLHIEQVDSEYSDPVQIVDLIGRLVFDSLRGKGVYEIDEINFINIFDISNIDSPKRKGPGHPY